MSLTPEEVATALGRVETQASFRPPPDDTDCAWWIAALRDERGAE